MKKTGKGSGFEHPGRLRELYQKYSQSAEKKELNARIIENNRWYKQLYTEYESAQDREKGQGQPKSKSGYIFSAIANKHADAMDNYPDINILPREENDAEEARSLTEVLPCILELCEFKKTYSQNWWYKLKNGAACYGVFWNPSLMGGLGDIEIKKVDLLNLSWQPGISDLQESKCVFYAYHMDKEEFVAAYGKNKLSVTEDASGIDTYSGNAADELRDSVLIVDCYYKVKNEAGASVVHLVKFSGENVLETTEGKAGYENGVYEHGMYPFVLDVMYPNEDSPAGFGVIDVVKSPQAYIDKLDALLQENALVVGKTRYFIKDNGGVNEDEFMDVSNPLVHVAGSLDENNLRPIDSRSLPDAITKQRENKINELKEVIGNRDFQQGGTSGGVTAASAITVLQQAGDKLSRDMIASSYMAYKQVVSMCIELVRQFYDVERKFRITGGQGDREFVSYSNARLQAQPVGGADAEGKADTGAEENAALRRPEFDVCLTIQKSNPFTKEQQNQTIMQLWGAGFFNPQAIDMSLIALKFMQFEGKDEMMNKLQEFSQEQAQLQQLLQRVEQMGQQMGQAMQAQEQIQQIGRQVSELGTQVQALGRAVQQQAENQQTQNSALREIAARTAGGSGPVRQMSRASGAGRTAPVPAPVSAPAQTPLRARLAQERAGRQPLPRVRGDLVAMQTTEG